MRKIRDILFRSNGFGCTSDIKSLNYGVCLISLVMVSRKIESSLLGNPFLNIIKLSHSLKETLENLLQLSFVKEIILCHEKNSNITWNTLLG